MKFSLERHIYFVFAVVFLLLVAMHSYFYQKTQDLQLAFKTRVHASEMLKTLKSLLSVLYEAESQKRGYVITGDPIFKESFQDSLHRMKRVQFELEQLGGGIPEYEGGLAHLASGLSKRVDSLSNILSIPHRELVVNAAINAKEGRRITEAVELMFVKVELDLQARLHESNSLVEKDFSALIQWGVVTIILSAVILLVACLYIYRDFRDLKELIESGVRQQEEEESLAKDWDSPVVTRQRPVQMTN